MIWPGVTVYQEEVDRGEDLDTHAVDMLAGVEVIQGIDHEVKLGKVILSEPLVLCNVRKW